MFGQQSHHFFLSVQYDHASTFLVQKDRESHILKFYITGMMKRALNQKIMLQH